MNIVRNAFAARSEAYDQGEKMRQDRARVQAGQQMERGSPEAAAGTLYGAGDLEGGAGMQKMQQQGEDRQLQQQNGEQAKKLEYMKRLGVAMQGIPMEQRTQAYQEKVGPALVQLGMSPQDVENAAAHLDDQSLQTFIGEMDKHIQVINRGGGGYDLLDTNTGRVTDGPDPTQRLATGMMLDESGNAVPDPSYIALQGAVSDARAGGVARHRAPRVGRSGGGRSGGSGGSSGVPSGFVLD